MDRIDFKIRIVPPGDIEGVTELEANLQISALVSSLPHNVKKWAFSNTTDIEVICPWDSDKKLLCDLLGPEARMYEEKGTWITEISTTAFIEAI